MSALKGLSVPAVSARQIDVCQSSEVEIDDDFERVGGGVVAEAFGQGGEPVGIVGLQRQQFGDSGAPTLGTGAARGLDPWVGCPML